MTDFNIQTSRWCSQNEHFEIQVPGSKGNTYTVRYGKTPQDPNYQYGWSCTCPAAKFQARYGDCKHVRKALKQRCTHGHDAVCGSPTPMGDTCPKCGSETSVISIAV